MSNYVVAQEPSFYGGQQENYMEQIEQLTERAALRFHQAIDAGEDLTALFHETLAFFGNERNRIAREHETEFAEAFGTRRDRCNLIRLSSITELVGVYYEYGKKMMDVFADHLLSNLDEEGRFTESQFTWLYEAEEGEILALEYSIYNAANADEWAFNPSWEEYQRLCIICSIPCEQTDFEENKFSLFTRNVNVARTLNERSPIDYHKLKLWGVIEYLKEEYQAVARDWIFVKKRSEANNQNSALSQFITWIPNGDEEPVSLMFCYAAVTIIHQDWTLIDSSLNGIAQIFKQALECDRNAIEELKTLSAKFQYRIADTMPFRRGSAAVSEIFERAIYRYHQYRLEYNPDCWVNLEAITSLEDDFISEYGSMIILTPNGGVY